MITIVPGIGEAGKSTAYVRKRNPAIDTDPEDQYSHFIALSDRCMHLGCPVRYVSAAERFICPCHGGVYDFRGMVGGGPPVRPLDRFYTRLENGHVEIGPRYSVNSRAAAASRRATRASRSTASASICIRRVLDLDASRDRTLVLEPPLPKALLAEAQAPGRRQRRPARITPAEAGITVVDWLDERTSLSAGVRWMLFRKVPKGINWAYTLGSATMFAFLSQAVTGVFLAMYYRPDADRRRLRVDPLHHRRCLPRPVRARHA